jgi:hypothetical protein
LGELECGPVQSFFRLQIATVTFIGAISLSNLRTVTIDLAASEIAA